MDQKHESLADLMTDIESTVPRCPPPGGYYSRTGDCVFFYLEEGPHVAERIDHVQTLFRDESSRRIIGTKIKGIRNLPKHDLLGLMVQQGRIEVITLLLLTYEHQKALGQVPEAAYLDAIEALGRPTVAEGLPECG